jgi:hypothetical protein
VIAAAALLCVGSDSASADNMLQNSSAESGNLPDADFWFQEFGSADVINDPALARTGSRVWALLSADPGNGISSVGQLPVVEVGERFTISGWVRIPNASPTHQPRVRIRWGFFAPGGGVFSSVSGGTDFALKDSNWTLVTSPEITCPADGAQLVARIYVYNTYQESDGGPQLPDTLGLNFPAYVDDLTAESPDYSFTTVSGAVTSDSVGVQNLVVRASQTANPAVSSNSSPTDSSGNYSLSARVGFEYGLSVASGMPADKIIGTVPAAFTPPDTTPITGQDITLVNNPNIDPELLYSLRSSSYAGGATWPTAYSSIGVTEMTTQGTPSVRTINGQNLVSNKRDGDGFRLTNIPEGNTLPFDGGTIVVAARPIRYAPGNAYQCLVSTLLDRFTLIVQRDTGRLVVWRNDRWFEGPIIPNGQITIFSVVVQPDGQFQVFLNGDSMPVMDITETSPFTAMGATRWFGTDVSVGKGWNGDGWSSFNGDIGDVYVYKVAIDQAKREALEDSLIAKFGTATNYTITASAGTGGAISPVGDISVPQNADQPFTITPAYGFLLDDVLVDGNSEGPITSYTFPDVTANHTIAANFIALPTISGAVTASATTDPIYSAVVSISQNADGSAPIEKTTTDSAGEYQLAPPDEFGTYYLIARKGGYVSSSVVTVAMTGVSVLNTNFALAKSATLDPLVSLDASSLPEGANLDSWPNTGSLGGTFNKYAGGTGPTVVADLAGKKAVDFSDQLTSNGGDTDRRTLGGTIVTTPEIGGNSDWTISAELYKADMGANGDSAFFSWAGWGHGYLRSAQFCYRDNKVVDHNGSGEGFNQVPNGGEWHTVTITYDGTTQKIYVDGVLDKSFARNLNIGTGDQLIIGSHSDVKGASRQWNDQYWRFNGAIASLQIYDQALTDEEVASLSVDPNDTDGDGMLDAWEIASFGNLDQDAADDFDSDGTDNLTEFRLGLAANSGSSRFALTGGAGGSIQWPSVTGVTFRIERSTTLTGWDVLEASYPGTDGTTSYTDPAPPTGRAFYRVTLNN